MTEATGPWAAGLKAAEAEPDGQELSHLRAVAAAARENPTATALDALLSFGAGTQRPRRETLK